MKNNKWMMASLLGGALLLTVSCVKETSKETGGIPGSPIVFSALSSYENNDATRTEYSGTVVDGVANKIERIDWVKDVDQFTVNYASTSQNSTGTYVVKSVDANGYNSKAGVAPEASSAILAWAGDTDHKFYAMYPSNAQNSAAKLTNKNHFQGTLNPTQDPRKKNGNYEMQEVKDYGIRWNRFMPDMKYAYMVAYADANNIEGNSVTLPFRPAVTTFEFRLRKIAGQAVANVKKFELVIADEIDGEDTPSLTGTFSFDITGGDERGGLWGSVTLPRSTDPGFSRTITVNFGDTGVALPDASANDYLDFTIFAVPVDLKGLSIRITDVNDKVRTLPLRDKENENDYHTFTGAKKWVITNSDIPGEWVYVLEEIPDIITYGHETVEGLGFNVKSYKYRKTVSGVPPTGDDAVKPVAWMTQYTLDGGVTWKNLTAAGVELNEDPQGVLEGTWNALFKTNILTGDGIGNIADAESREASIEGESQGDIVGDVAAAAQRAKLVTHDPRGSMTAPFDLSTHPIYNDAAHGISVDVARSQTTANSYVVSAPGVYMFPCVYGNAITNDEDNKSAYWPGSSNAHVEDPNASTLAEVSSVYMFANEDESYWRTYAPRFYNAIDEPIGSPYILSDVGANYSSKNAAVIWQDTEEGDEIIPFEDGYVGMTTKTIGSRTVDYIWFKLDQSHIKPGNFVIALRGSVPGRLSEDTNILWSWHIWVTADNLAPETLGDFQIMPRNMGWFDSDKGSAVHWPIRQIQYRIVQTEAYGKNGTTSLYKDEPFLVKQIGEAKSTKPSVGGNVYYQWGRKDPFLPSTPDNKNHVSSFNSDYAGKYTMTTTGIQKKDLQVTNLDYGAGIREPFNPFSNPTSLGAIGGPTYPFWKYIGGGTQVETWTFKTDHEKRGPFNVDQALAIQETAYCDQPDWEMLTADGQTYYHSGVDFYMGPYTNEEKVILLDHGFDEDDFTESSGGWKLKYWKIGPFNFDDAVAVCNTRYNELGPAHWLIPAIGEYYFCLKASVPFNYGPYYRPDAEVLALNGFSVDLETGDFIYETTTVGGGYVPYSAELRSKASNPSNLWNSYIYDEQTEGSSYVNKFKTIYDPCPPGYTVPSKQVYVGTLGASSMVRNWHNVPGQPDYHTPLKPLTKEVPGPAYVFPGLDKALLDAGSNDKDKKGLVVGSGDGVFFPYTGARIFRFADYVEGVSDGTPGTATMLHAEGVGTGGYYWTDNPLKMEYHYDDPAYQTELLGTDIGNDMLWFYFDGYALIFGNNADGYVTNNGTWKWKVQSYTRPTAFSIRPMKDPKVSY